jgi:FixJ family two-component response regulator
MVEMVTPRVATVHLIDPDGAAASRLRALMEDEDARILHYQGARQFQSESPEERPACIVTEATLPGEDALKLVETIRSADCPPPVIVFAEQISVRKAVEAMTRGATFVLEKSGDLAVLKRQILNALKNDAIAVRRCAESAKTLARFQTLSQRERQVADLIFQGLETKTIAARLGISTKTVEYHRAQIFNKVGVSNAVQLASAMFQVEGRVG